MCEPLLCAQCGRRPLRPAGFRAVSRRCQVDRRTAAGRVPEGPRDGLDHGTRHHPVRAGLQDGRALLPSGETRPHPVQFAKPSTNRAERGLGTGEASREDLVPRVDGSDPVPPPWTPQSPWESPTGSTESEERSDVLGTSVAPGLWGLGRQGAGGFWCGSPTPRPDSESPETKQGAAHTRGRESLGAAGVCLDGRHPAQTAPCGDAAPS